MSAPQKLYINQKHVSFQNMPRNSNNPYNEYNRSALQKAMNNLSNSALKLYLYFGNFRNLPAGIYLSKQDAMKYTNLSERSYFNGIKELTEKGYLELDKNDSYILYENP